MKDDEGYKELIKMLRQEIHELKQISCENEKNKNLLQGYKKVIVDLSNKLRREDS